MAECFGTEGEAYRPEKADGEPPVVLIAPTWGDMSIFNTCGEELISVLLGAGYRVIMRPHYQSNRQTPEVIAKVRGELVSQFELSPYAVVLIRGGSLPRTSSGSPVV